MESRRSMFAGGVAACALGVLALVQAGSPPVTSLVAQLQQPPSGLKLRPGDRIAVRIRVEGGSQNSVHWDLSLRREGGDDEQLAAGNGSAVDAVVAELVADALAAGENYTLSLAASDGQTTVQSTATILVTDAPYSVIPLGEGNSSQVGLQVYGSNASGDLLFYSGLSADPAQILLLDRKTGQRELLRVRVGDSESVRLAGDGSRLFYRGTFPPPAGPPPHGGSGLGFLDLNTRSLSMIDRDAGVFYSTDATGRRIAYQGIAPSNTVQYFLYDEAVGTPRQLTDDPQAIRYRLNGEDDCPQILGTRPFISADGSTVVVITKATLGLAPPDDAVGCRVFAYAVAGGEWRQVAALPRAIVVDVPTLSDDGRFLSFRAQGRPGIPPSALLLNLDTGELNDPAADIGAFAAADSVVTGDGQGIVISSQADLDPRVGNADHNLELFYYDFATRRFSQISETIGGIGSTPGGCPSYRPFVSRDGGVLTFHFHWFSVERCHLDGPMRNARDGLVYGFVRAVRRRPGNHGPVLSSVSDQRVTAGETLTLSLAASDPDEDPISFFAQVKDGTDVPPGSLVTDHHDGTATFTWPTRPENAGTVVLRVAAFDEGGGEVVRDVTITVVGSNRSPTASATPSITAFLSTNSPTPATTTLPTPAARGCASDCNDNGQVSINELLTATTIALGNAPLTACPPAACGPTPAVSIICLTRAVSAALGGCP